MSESIEESNEESNESTQYYNDIIRELIDKILNFINTNNNLLGKTDLRGDDSKVPEQKSYVKGYIFNKFPTKFQEAIKKQGDFSNMDSLQEAIARETPRERSERIQIMKDITDTVFSFYVNMERILPRNNNNNNLKETAENYLSSR